MKTAGFDYDFPRELIAQRPTPERDASRMLHLDRATGAITHRSFRDFPDLLRPDDVMVVNESRVIKARLHGRRDNGRIAEILLVHPDVDDTWIAMAHPGGKLKPGRTVTFDGETQLEIIEVLGGGLRRVRLRGGSWTDVMARYGDVPLPPYIDRPPEPDDVDRYQTVFARCDGSVAAPTAGLHFTEQILTRIEQRGTTVVRVLLHVGPGTFKPVGTDDPAAHVMHAEQYRVSDHAAEAINRARAAGGRVWAIGTTVTRVLETVAAARGDVRGGSGWTDLFIRPPFAFRVVDAMLTNFHLPRSTLLMLVCAFGGYNHVMDGYRTAVTERYRLYSYGDAMVVV
ncbi:MAG: tRNA preQ1(34) S-adenosylmethionine ribosyltransferase-isomerase QueA [Gemmatimonadetes bacterium]|nr:tRNA preQ1(34) S-adenosylmethionine ribosyltransferase-isomerase QueA [Gemmatimonadota bacterium]